MIETAELIQSAAILLLAGAMFFDKRIDNGQIKVNKIQSDLNESMLEVFESQMKAEIAQQEIINHLVNTENARQSLNENDNKNSEES